MWLKKILIFPCICKEYGASSEKFKNFKPGMQRMLFMLVMATIMMDTDSELNFQEEEDQEITEAAGVVVEVQAMTEEVAEEGHQPEEANFEF